MREQSDTKKPIVSSLSPITLLGGADLGTHELNISLSHAPIIVAADGGADHAFADGHSVTAVIGDLDSISDAARTAYADRVHQSTDLDTTDFEKLLNSVSAPLLLCCGFLGGRLDHTMGVLNVIARYADVPVILLSTDDVVFVAPSDMHINLPIGVRIGLLPLGEVNATSQGLRWNLDRLDLQPTRWVSSSNEVAAGQVTVTSQGPLLVTLPLAQLDAAIDVVRVG